MKARSIKKLIIFAALLCMLLYISLIAAANDETMNQNIMAELYVSPEGNRDNGDGSFEKPFANIEQAKEAVREILGGEITGNIVVYLREGKYYVNSTIRLDEADSGRDDYNVIYTNYQDENPVIIRGKSLTGWKKVEGEDYYKIKIDKNENIQALYENGVRGVPARYPNEVDGEKQYLHTDKMIEGAMQTRKFGFESGDIPKLSDTENLIIDLWPGGLSGYWSWFEETNKVKEIDYDTNVITLEESARYPLGVGTRYFLQGRKELMDVPGEFYYDAEKGELYYWPRENNIDKSEIILPGNGHIFYMYSAGNIIFDGIKFMGTDVDYDAINMVGCENITIKRSEISNIGGIGVYVDGSIDIEIKNNLIYETGDAGVCIYLTEEANIINNHIYDTGNINGSRAVISLNGTYNSLVAHNLIHEAPRSAITLLEDVNNGTIIEYNDIFNCMQDSQDGGSIGSWGTGEDIIIRNNIIHDSSIPKVTLNTNRSWQFGIYLDDNSFGFDVYNNIIHSMQEDEDGGIISAAICSKGWDNKLYNNIIADNRFVKGGTAFVTLNSGSETYNIEIFNNISYRNTSKENKFFRNVSASGTRWREDTFRYLDKNVYFNPSGKYYYLKKNKLLNVDDWKSLGYEKKSIFDKFPKFIDADEHDYRLRYDSPAYLLGFRDINVQDIGLKENYHFAVPDEKLDRIFVKKEGSTVNSATINLISGGSTKLEVMGRTKTGYVANLDGANIEYMIDNTEIADLDDNGNIKAVESGVAEIIVKVSKQGIEKKKKLYVFVNDEIESINIVPAKDKTLLVGEKERFNVVCETKYGQILNLSKNSTYTSDKSEIVEVEKDGIIIAKAEGKVELAVKVDFNGEEYNLSSQIEIVTEKSIQKTNDEDLEKEVTEEAKNTEDIEDKIDLSLPPGYENVALNKTVEVDSVYDNNYNLGGSRAVDGNIETKWNSNNSEPHWLKIDLGEMYNIKKFIIKHAEAGGEAAGYNTSIYKIQTSIDDSKYTDRVVVTDNTNKITSHDIDSVKARYVKLYIPDSCRYDKRVRIYEFEIWGKSLEE